VCFVYNAVRYTYNAVRYEVFCAEMLTFLHRDIDFGAKFL
jgi:hypothetical protein